MTDPPPCTCGSRDGFHGNWCKADPTDDLYARRRCRDCEADFEVIPHGRDGLCEECVAAMDDEPVYERLLRTMERALAKGATK